MRLPIAGIALVLAACGGGIRINTDYDPDGGPRLVALHRWDWLAAPAGAEPRDSALTREITTLLEQALLDHGFQRSADDPEFQIGWHAAVTRPIDVTAANSYYGYAWGRWFPGGGVVFGRGYKPQFETGSLVVDLVEVRTHDLVWRGIARDAFRGGRDPAERRRALDEAVRRIVAQTPQVRATQR